MNYRVTEKGIDLAPVLRDLLSWGARHDDTGIPCALVSTMEEDRKALITAVLTEVRRRWRDRDLIPFLPKFKRSEPGEWPDFWHICRF